MPADPLDQAVEHFQAGRPEQAVTALRRALQKTPNNAPAQNMLGLCMIALRQYPSAVYHVERAIKLEPRDPRFHRTLAMAYQATRELPKAKAACEEALRLDPTYWAALTELGNIVGAMGDVVGAERCQRRATELAPHYAPNWVNLSGIVAESSRFDEAMELVRRGLEHSPDDLSLLSAAQLLMNYIDSVTPEDVLASARRYGAAADALAARSGLLKRAADFTNSREPDRPLRVGFISPDFRTHSVSFFFQSLIEHLPEDRIRSYCYDTDGRADAMTARIRSHADVWRDAAPYSAPKLVEAARADRLDIAVELSGHTRGHALTAMACRVAPVQVTFLGYPATTGVTAMDWRLVDSLTDPPGAERFCSERLHRLDPCLWCFRAPDDSPPVSALPCDSTGHLTFGSFNAMPKMSPTCLDLWARVLHAVPGSRLIVKNKPLQDQALRAVLAEKLGARGISPDRVELLGAVPSQGEHMKLYSRIDAALDTYPYHGTTTTCDALWMGVPTLALIGPAHVSRVSLSLLSAVGLSDLAARTPDAFVSTAVAYVSDRDRMRAVRASLRERMRLSALCDGPSYGVRFAEALRAMWHDWCRV